MSGNRKVIARITVSPLYPLYYDVNETNVRLKYLYNTIKGSIVDYRNSMIGNSIQTPYTG